MRHFTQFEVILIHLRSNLVPKTTVGYNYDTGNQQDILERAEQLRTVVKSDHKPENII